jgi:hypothetical protein
LLPYRGQSLEGFENVLARVVDYPVSVVQSAVILASIPASAPNLSQSLIHGTLLCLLDGNLQPFRLARTFWISRRIANSAIGSLIHISCTVSSTTLGHCRSNIGCIYTQIRRAREAWSVRATISVEGKLATMRWCFDVQTQAVTRDMLHDDGCGGRARILASSVRLMGGFYVLDSWVDAQ